MPAFELSDLDFGEERPIRRGEKLAVVGKAVGLAAKACLRHPLVVLPSPKELFGNPYSEHVLRRGDRRDVLKNIIAIELADYILTREIGPPNLRMEVCDWLEDIRDDHGLAEMTSVQEMKQTENFKLY